MQAHSAAHKHRHFKTLILLVISMTVGAFFLFWLGKMTPVTPLRGKSKVAANWNRITVRTAEARESDLGFFHYRIDPAGQLWQTSAWKVHSSEPGRPGAIQIVLSMPTNRGGISPSQEKALARLIRNLRDEFAISAERIRLEKGPTLASTIGVDSLTAIGL